MTDTPCRFITLSVTTIDMPAATSGSMPASTYLAAIAMLIAERDADSRWSFAQRSQAIGAGDGEDRLLAWATGAFLETGTVIGWKLADDIVAPLLAAGRDGDPDIAKGFLHALLALVTTPSIDLALFHGGAGAAAIETIASRRGIVLATTDPHEFESAWAFGDTQRLADHAAAHALAAWELWLAEANGGAEAVARAYADWRRR